MLKALTVEMTLNMLCAVKIVLTQQQLCAPEKRFLPKIIFLVHPKVLRSMGAKDHFSGAP